MKILSPINENKDIIDKKYVDDGLSDKQVTLISGTNIKTINNESLLGSGNISISGGGTSTKNIDASDDTEWDSRENEPTQTVLQDIATHEYEKVVIENLPFGDGVFLEKCLYLSIKLDAGDVHLRQYVRFEDGDEEENEPATIETWAIGNFDQENPTNYMLLTSSKTILQDVKINGISVVQNNEANIVTNGSYNAITNPLATIGDIPTDTSDLTNGADFQNSTQVESTITGKGYITSSNVAFTNQSNSFTNNQTFNGGITVNGNITQNGSSYETHAEKVYTTKDYIYLRDGATGGLASGSYSGFEAKKYDGTNDGRLVFDSSGVARVGDVGDEQALATRAETPTDGATVVWDASSLKLISGFKIVACTTAEYNSSSKDSNTIYLITD